MTNAFMLALGKINNIGKIFKNSYVQLLVCQIFSNFFYIKFQMIKTVIFKELDYIKDNFKNFKIYILGITWNQD